MITALNSEVLVVLMDDRVVPGLEEASRARRWPVLKRPTAGQALREIRACRPRVVVMQVSGSLMVLEQAASLSRWLGTAPPRPDVVAIAGEHTETVERAMRSAGARCYLTDDVSRDAIDHVIAQLGDGPERDADEQTGRVVSRSAHQA